ncbi:Nramp family divalent metal transporter [Isoptericola sp. S6320L]|uniref:Nramp family divalent metal transporter n=1 Tax=Isoptericola sp. S6320L TaxID=2926411 RepID=UPI001FF1E6F8|nr:Nramp family divalent metal transporter [Isoptericola sp. S6320L]MCK0116465.1 Nramp family divalent metal transporter [Isoptericola sp. S6320L]
MSTRTAPPGLRRLRALALLGPAFVAAIAYVDPGNVAANLTAGAEFGYLLVWVLVMANAMAVLVQYLSAKLGVVTGRSLPEVLADRMPRRGRIAYWLQAEAVAMATDLAEVIGGAIALNLLFGVPLVAGGLITGAVSMVVLAIQQRRGQRIFETVVVTMLGVIAVGFCAGLLVAPPDAGAVLGGLVPRFDGADSVLLAASMLGATVMPHAIYLHSSLARDRVRHDAERRAAVAGVPPSRTVQGDPTAVRRLLRATRWDVVAALLIAGGVNIAMLLLAAANLPGRTGTDSIEGAYAAISESLGPIVAVLFGVGLLTSGLASTAVGAYAGSEIMAGLLRVRVPLLTRRLVTLVPALLLLATDVSPTYLLVLSQVVLSFGIPFAMIPLVRVTRDAGLLGEFRNARATQAVAWLVAAVIVGLNVTLLWLTVTG